MKRAEPGQENRRDRKPGEKIDQPAIDRMRIALELAYGVEEVEARLQEQVEQGWFDYSADHPDVEGSSLSIEVTRYLRHMGPERFGTILIGMDSHQQALIRELIVSGNIEKLIPVLDSAENRDKLSVLWADSGFNRDGTPISSGGSERFSEYMLDRRILVDRYKMHAQRVRAGGKSEWQQIETLLNVKGLLEDKGSLTK